MYNIYDLAVAVYNAKNKYEAVQYTVNLGDP